MRLGIAWQTPSYLWLTDQFNTQLSNTYYNNRRDTSLTAYSPDGEFTYRLTTPSHTVLSVAGVSKMGFISIDIDFMNPQNAHYNLTADSDNAGDYEFQEELNKDIEKQFKSIIQYRLGAEFVIQNSEFEVDMRFWSKPMQIRISLILHIVMDLVTERIVGTLTWLTRMQKSNSHTHPILLEILILMEMEQSMLQHLW